MNSKYVSLLYQLNVVIIAFSKITKANEEANKGIKQMVEEAGCPFVSDKQLLVRNVCLLPYYYPNVSPKNSEGNSDVEIYYSANVLEIDEKKNKITVTVRQDMYWQDHRISANFSAVPNDVILLATNSFLDIWHPDLDMFTKRLQDWKSLYDPRLYKETFVAKSNKSEKNWIQLRALKDWRATLFCNFEFSSFPFDTQHCTFEQYGRSDSINVSSYPSGTNEPWIETVDGYETILQDSKVFAGFDITLSRNFEPYLYEYYFPCAAIVVISHISFIIPLSAIPGRVALLVTMFLTLTNIFIYQIVRRISINNVVYSNNNIDNNDNKITINLQIRCASTNICLFQSDSPSGATLNALGVYLLVSLAFMIAAMFEFALVLLIKRCTCPNETKIYPSNRRKDRRLLISQRRSHSITDKIDFSALFVFSLFYIIFNCAYMAQYQ